MDKVATLTPHEHLESVVTEECLEFLKALNEKFNNQRINLLEIRSNRQQLFDEGYPPGYDLTTDHIRDGDWKCAPIPDSIKDRRVEITGPPERKMVINAMNSGAKVYMADFEDSSSPTWSNMIEGQVNLRDAVDGSITYEHPTKGTYKLKDNPAVLFVRPRGLHLEEKNFLINGSRTSGSLFDFGVFIFNSGKTLSEKGLGPFFYLPKLEDSTEAKWWAEVFKFSEEYLNIPIGTIRATVLLETLPAAFQMNEILWELQDYSAGLNCGRWDYIFSYIKIFRNNSMYTTPDRSQITMDSHFMKSYSEMVIQTCHKRGVHAMGGMAAQIPIKGDESANEAAMLKVRKDKLREVIAGHDGTWVAHPGLVEIAMGIFNDNMERSNQIHLATSYDHSREDLLASPIGTITMDGLRQNIDVGIKYIAAWLNGNGCVPLYNLMEDAATAEISRTQVWQWIKHNACIDETQETITGSLVKQIANEIVEEDRSCLLASQIFVKMCTSRKLDEFLTTSAYELI